MRPSVMPRSGRISWISIHAPTWGATHVALRPPLGVVHFNPRTHVGCDLLVQGAEFQPDKISIHAPTWGATSRHPPPRSYTCISIHAPTWGATRGNDPMAMMAAIFQSTHPRGVRLIEMSMSPVTRLFQSTHPRGVRRRSRTARIRG